jgi:signal transduction histidine kinase
MAALPEAHNVGAPPPADIHLARISALRAVDPAWALAEATTAHRAEPLSLIAESPWWPASLSSGPAADVLGRIWRHSVAVSGAARSLARNAGDHEPEAVARAGLLCRLGCWIVAAVDPQWVARWWNEEDASSRRHRESSELGLDLNELGRRMAEAWGCEPLVVDAAWLCDDSFAALSPAAHDPERLALIQEACRWAERTPWSLTSRAPADSIPSEPRLRILVAEVQARCGTAFVAPDATPHEERMTRQNARLRLGLATARQAQSKSERFLRTLADSPPAESPQDWAARAALSWCAEPEVRSARVIWCQNEPQRPSAELPEPAAPALTDGNGAPELPSPRSVERPPDLVFPFMIHGRTRAHVELWCDPERAGLEQRIAASATRVAWEAWATLLVDRALLEHRLARVVASAREVIQTREARLRESKLDALSEFAAGAGHELNNPLAVVVGRAQLLLARAEDPETARSLRIILNHAGRAHRILRDLMFVARPPAPRRRACRPVEVLRLCLRDVEADCQDRGILLTGELEEPGPTTWADPEWLRHVAEILLRNAVQATPPGGKIELRASQVKDELVYSVSDTGRGISSSEAAHLFDPFYCGRQAGRGLGLGLPRAARVVELEGGRLSWASNPGHGVSFRVHLPLAPAPERGDRPPDASSSVPRTAESSTGD